MLLGSAWSAPIVALAMALCATPQFAEPALGNDAAPAQAQKKTLPGSSVLGIEVRRAGTTIGRIIDLLVRSDGNVEAAVIEYGGFLGIGSRKVAIAWPELRLERDGQQLVAHHRFDK
jgi:PRC-barrel domain